MNPGIVRKVFAKELRETLRDRRTLLVMLVVPIFLYPALLIVMQQLAIFGQRQLQEAPASVLAQGAEPEILARLNADARLSVATVDVSGVERVAVGEADVFLRFGPQDESIAGSGVQSPSAAPSSPDGRREVTVVFDASRDRSRIGREAVLESLSAWEDSLLEARVAALGLPAGFAEPLMMADSSVASAERMGGYTLGRFLPMLLILMTLLGAFYPAIDLSAGEKERGTLETILTTPIGASDFVAGKFLTVTVIGVAAAALNLASILLTFRLAAFQLGEGLAVEFTLPWTTIALVMASLVPLTVLFAALFLGIALRAQSFKEAQNALTPVQLASMIPIMLPIIPGMPLNYALALVPVGGLALLFREMMSGGAAMGPGLAAVGATVVYAGLALRFAAASFGREEVLFGSGDGKASVRDQLRLWSSGGASAASPTAVLGFAAGVGLLFFYVGPLLMRAFGQPGIMLSQMILIAVPSLLFVKLGNLGVRAGLGFRSPRIRHLAGGLLLAAGGLPVAWLIGWLQSFVLEVPEAFLTAFEDLIKADSPQDLAWLLLIVAITPAICEELLFRGVLLRGLLSRASPSHAIVTSAIIFGLFHLSTETAIRLLPSAWLGLLLGYAAWRTGSLLVSMVMHFLNNAVIVLIIAIPSLEAWVSDGSGAPTWWTVVAGLFFLVLAHRVLAQRKTEEVVPLTSAPLP